MNQKNSRQSFLNDDYSRFSGPDYREVDYDFYTDEGFSIGQVDFEQQKNLERIRAAQGSSHRYHPRLSPKERYEGSWFNESQYRTQKNFIGRGPKGYRRADIRIYEDVCDTLTMAPDIDASDIEVEVDQRVVILKGHVGSRYEKKTSEAILENLPGVEEVRNQLKIGMVGKGTEGMIKNQSRAS